MRLFYQIYKVLPVSIRWGISYLFSTKFLVGIKAVVIRKGEILLLKNTYQYYWSLPGGYLNSGESLKKSIEREIKEEIGINVKMERIIKIETRAKKPLVDIVVLCKYISGKIIVDNQEVEEAAFFKINELPNPEGMPKSQLKFLRTFKFN